MHMAAGNTMLWLSRAGMHDQVQIVQDYAN